MTKPTYEERELRKIVGRDVLRRQAYSAAVAPATILEILDELARVRGLLQRYSHHDETCDIKLWQDEHCSCGLEIALAQPSGAESADIGKLDGVDEKAGYCGGCRNRFRKYHSCVHGNCACKCNPGSAETGGEKAACEHENAECYTVNGKDEYNCSDCGARIPVAIPACTATVHTADCDKTGECDRLDDYVTGVKETPPNFRRTSQNQTVSSGVEGAHEGTTASLSKSGAESVQTEKQNTADKSELLPTQLPPDK